MKYLAYFESGLVRYSKVRELFNELVQISPPCKELYTKMISYEKSHTRVNLNNISKLYNDVCFKVGYGDVGKFNHSCY